MTHKCIYQICEYAFVTRQFQKSALCGLIFENTPFACNRSWRSLGETCSVWGRGLETIKKHANTQSNKQKGQRTINKKTQTINQAHHQSNQTVSQERKHTNPKKKPYIKKIATPDRPPPAAVMLVVV